MSSKEEPDLELDSNAVCGLDEGPRSGMIPQGYLEIPCGWAVPCY